MIFLTEIATRRFNRIIEEGVNHPDAESFKIDNAEGAYMALTVEMIGSRNCPTIGEGKMWSFTHYYTQNGDAMRDPEVCFFVTESGLVIPYYTRTDAAGIEMEVIDLEKGTISLAAQKDLCQFCSMWFKNIFQQQGLTLLSSKA